MYLPRRSLPAITFQNDLLLGWEHAGPTPSQSSPGQVPIRFIPPSEYPPQTRFGVSGAQHVSRVWGAASPARSTRRGGPTRVQGVAIRPPLRIKPSLNPKYFEPFRSTWRSCCRSCRRKQSPRAAAARRQCRSAHQPLPLPRGPPPVEQGRWGLRIY